MNKVVSIFFAVVLLIIALWLCLFQNGQEQYAVVVSKSSEKRIVSEPGVYWRLPSPFETVTFLDKRLLLTQGLDNSASLITQDKQPVVVGWDLRWRITNPSEYAQNVGVTTDAGSTKLNELAREAFQKELALYSLKKTATSQQYKLHSAILFDINNALNAEQRPMGIEMVDVLVTKINYASSALDAVYEQMGAAQKQIVSDLQSAGQLEAKKIRDDAESQQKTILANTAQSVQAIRTEGESEATKIYINSFGRDPNFAKFYSTLEAYKSVFGKGEFMIVSPDDQSEFMKLFLKGPGKLSGDK